MALSQINSFAVFHSHHSTTFIGKLARCPIVFGADRCAQLGYVTKTIKAKRTSMRSPPSPISEPGGMAYPRGLAGPEIVDVQTASPTAKPTGIRWGTSPPSFPMGFAVGSSTSKRPLLPPSPLVLGGGLRPHLSNRLCCRRSRLDPTHIDDLRPAAAPGDKDTAHGENRHYYCGIGRGRLWLRSILRSTQTVKPKRLRDSVKP
jgi:hypothetical protein